MLALPANPIGPNVRAELTHQLLKGVFDPRTFNQTSLHPNFGPDKVHSYSFGIEREISKNSALELRYVGNHATNLFQSVNANPFIADLARDFPNLVPAGVTPARLPTYARTGTDQESCSGRENCMQVLFAPHSTAASPTTTGFQAEFRANNLFKQLTIRPVTPSARTWTM